MSDNNEFLIGYKGKKDIENGTWYNMPELIDDTGKLIMPEQYDYIWPSKDCDMLAVGTRLEGTDDMFFEYKCKYIDKKGKDVMKLPDRYVYAGPFTKVK